MSYVPKDVGFRERVRQPRSLLPSRYPSNRGNLHLPVPARNQSNSIEERFRKSWKHIEQRSSTRGYFQGASSHSNFSSDLTIVNLVPSTQDELTSQALIKHNDRESFDPKLLSQREIELESAKESERAAYEGAQRRVLDITKTHVEDGLKWSPKASAAAQKLTVGSGQLLIVVRDEFLSTRIFRCTKLIIVSIPCGILIDDREIRR